MPRQLGDVTGMLQAKQDLGITTTVIGSPVGAGAMVPLPGVDNYAQTEDELSRLHGWLAGLVGTYPEQLRGYVYVNPFGGATHLANAADRARQPEFVGFIANSSVRGRYLLDAEADEFFGMVADLDLPVLLHAPAAPAAGRGLTELPLIEQLGRFSDVTIGIACCLLGGWFEKYPALRVVASAGAGALGLLIEKLDQAWAPAHWGGGAAGAGTPTSALARLSRPPSSFLDRDAPPILAEYDVQGRTQLINGDVFADHLPAGADLYTISRALHDFDEVRVAQILANIRAAARPGARLAVLDGLMPEGPGYHPAKIADLIMMTILGGRFYTEREMSELLTEAGFEFVGVTMPPPGSDPRAECLIEAVAR